MTETTKESSFSEEARDKLKEVGWFVVMALLKWLIEYLTRGNPGEGEGDAETKH